jgi:hypothetical protein
VCVCECVTHPPTNQDTRTPIFTRTCTHKTNQIAEEIGESLRRLLAAQPMRKRAV